jgi:hypothetical protein
VIPARATAAAGCHGTPFDLFRQAAPIVHLSLASGGEEVLIGRGAASLRLSIVEGTLLQGPVMLGFHLEGTDRLQIDLNRLGRLARYLRSGHVTAPKPRTDRGARRRQILRVLDALATGASYREIARVLYGVDAVTREWDGTSDHMRSRTRRLVAQARRLVRGGYLDIVSARTPSRRGDGP